MTSALKSTQKRTMLGLIGGSGLYDLPGLADGEWQRVESPFGDPSDAILGGEIDGMPAAFLPRHGRGHRIPPSDINYRANIDALKRLGVTDVFSLSACGSFREDLAPGTFVLPDQFIDRTKSRAGSFFGPGCVAHVNFADPTCKRLRTALAQSLSALGVRHHVGGTYLAMEGPQFSTRAESLLYKSWGCHVIGMTNMPEARLAREA
ncbi:MAG: S-methyl-5'-thioadenosine phosphorylase, partial [Pseudomonadota bacterium]